MNHRAPVRHKNRPFGRLPFKLLGNYLHWICLFFQASDQSGKVLETPFAVGFTGLRIHYLSRNLHFLRFYVRGKAQEIVHKYSVCEENYDATWKEIVVYYENKRLTFNSSPLLISGKLAITSTGNTHKNRNQSDRSLHKIFIEKLYKYSTLMCPQKVLYVYTSQQSKASVD